MASVYDRVAESSISLGFSSFALAGELPGFIKFGDKAAHGEEVHYTATFGDMWEIGIGTYDGSSNVLERTTILASSNAGVKTLFPAGIKQVFCSLNTFALQGFILATDKNHTWTKAQRGAFVEIAPAGSITLDFDTSNNFFILMDSDTTLETPDNLVSGQSGVIELSQNTDGSELTFSSFWKFAGGTVPNVTQTTGARDVLSYLVNFDGTSATCTMLNDVK